MSDTSRSVTEPKKCVWYDSYWKYEGYFVSSCDLRKHDGVDDGRCPSCGRFVKFIRDSAE